MDTISSITVSGPDAFEFLQGQLTNDLRRLDAQATLLCAWCNPKGRVICLMTVTRTPDGYSISIPTDLADDIIKRLTMFRFRSKVEFEILPDSTPVIMSENIESGVPWVGLEQSEKFTPHMLNLDLLDAISLDKGCYTGQEIVARTHYKGASKRRMLRFESEAPVSVGDKVSCSDRDIGEVLNVAENELLAVVPTDKANQELSINGIALVHSPLPYLEL
jgi:folate-binding protein YgfZ